jgi:hypothetical protein
VDMLNFMIFHACNAEDTCPDSPWNFKNGVPSMTLPDVYPYGFVSNRGPRQIPWFINVHHIFCLWKLPIWVTFRHTHHTNLQCMWGAEYPRDAPCNTGETMGHGMLWGLTNLNWWSASRGWNISEWLNCAINHGFFTGMNQLTTPWPV